MADQTATGLPEGAVVGEPLQDGAQAKPVQKQIPQPVQNTGLPEGAVVGPAMTPKQHNGSPKGAVVGPTLPEKPASLVDTLGSIKHNVGNISSAMDNKAPADITPQQQGVAEVGKGVRAAYRYVTGETKAPKVDQSHTPVEAQPTAQGAPVIQRPTINMQKVNPVGSVLGVGEHLGVEKPVTESVMDASHKLGAAGVKAGEELAQVPIKTFTALSHPPTPAEQSAPFGSTQTSEEEAKTSQVGAKHEAEVGKAAAEEHPLATGIAKATGGTVGGLVADPTNWALALATGGAGPVASKLASAAFAAGMGKGVVDGATQLGANWDKMTPEQRYEEITRLGLQTVFAGMAGAHSVPTMKDIEAARTSQITKDLANAPGVRNVITPELSHLDKQVDKAQKALEEAKKETNYDAYKHSAAKGVLPPAEVVKVVDKAQKSLNEAIFHRDTAMEAHKAKVDKFTAPKPVAAPVPSLTPEVPTAQVEAAPVLQKLGAPKPAAEPINVKRPGQVQPETFPQIPTEAPRSQLGRIDLANEQGTVGKQRMLPETASAGLPQIKATAPEVLPPEKPAAKPERGNVKALTVDEKGNVIDKEATPEGRIGKLLQDALKPSAPEDNKGAAPKDNATTEAKPLTKAEAKAHAEQMSDDNRASDRRTSEEPHEGEERRKSERRVLEGINQRTFQESAFGKGEEKRIDTDAYARASEQARKELGPDASKEAVIARRNELVAPEAKGATGDIGAKSREANPEPTRAETKGEPEPNKMSEAGPKNTDRFPAMSDRLKAFRKTQEPGLMKAGEEGREPAKSAAEYHSAVQQKVSELSDENLRKLAKAHGLTPSEYDFNARDEHRHRVERDQLAKDITEQLGDDEKINVGRAAESAEKEGTFKGADVSAQGRAARAAKVFPRLRGPVDEFGNPKVSGGTHADDIQTLKKDYESKRKEANDLRAQAGKITRKGPKSISLVEQADTLNAEADKAEEQYKKKLMEPTNLSSEKVGTKEAADKDTEHFANAKKELGPKASISEIAKRAQEMKDTHAQLTAHEENGGSTFSSKGKNLNGTDKYSVGAYPDRTEQVDKLTPERLEEFKKKNADVLSKEDHAVGTWKDPDTDKAVLDVTKLYDGKDEAIAAGKAANQKAIYHLGGEGEIQTGGTGRVNSKGSPVDEFGNPTVSGGAPEKKLLTGDELIKKYGESSGDPAHTTFILKDGRGVANTGIEHDRMLGGTPTDKVPPRERFVADGNIRIRPRSGGKGGREVSISIPESGINEKQLAYLKKMSPQLRSGAVLIEIGKPGGGYKVIDHGAATSEALEKNLRELAPILNDKGSPIDENGNPTVSGGSPEAGTAKAKGNLFREAPAREGRNTFRDEATEFDPNKFKTQTSELEPYGKKKPSLNKIK